MTQDIKHIPSLSNAPRDKPQSAPSLEQDRDALREQLRAAQDSILFLKSEHALTLRGLHEEVERLQELCRDLQFKCEAGGYLLPTSEFFRCGASRLERKVRCLQEENAELGRQLVESRQAIDILDQKEKLSLWRYHQEVEQRDSAILHLQGELEAALANAAPPQTQAAGGIKHKKGTFWRRFSFSSPSQSPKSSPKHDDPASLHHHSRIEHLSREDLPSEIKNSLPPPYDSQFPEDPYKLPPIPNLPPASTNQRRLVRQQLRVHGLAGRVVSEKVPIDHVKSPTDGLPMKRIGKA